MTGSKQVTLLCMVFLIAGVNSHWLKHALKKGKDGVKNAEHHVNDVIKKVDSDVLEKGKDSVKDAFTNTKDHVKDVIKKVDVKKVIDDVKTNVKDVIASAKQDWRKTLDILENAKNNLTHVTKLVYNDVISDVSELREVLTSDPDESSSKGCRCDGKTHGCGCCGGFHIEDLKLKFCTNVSYDPVDYGVALTVTVNNFAVINVTVSAKNPPPICVKIPKLKKLFAICVDLYNLDVIHADFKGCIKLQIRFAYVIHQDIELGCFDIPFKDTITER